MNVLVEYTESLPLRKESSLVEGIFYNANNQTVVFDLQDRIYRYNNVGHSAALSVANAVSAGSEYQRFKRRFGPGESLGEYGDIEWQKVGTFVKAGTNLYVNGVVVNPGSIKAENLSGDTISRLNLSAEAEPLQGFKVGFVVGSGTENKYHNLFAKSFADAVSIVEGLGKMLGLEFNVKEVSVVD